MKRISNSYSIEKTWKTRRCLLFATMTASKCIPTSPEPQSTFTAFAERSAFRRTHSKLCIAAA